MLHWVEYVRNIVSMSGLAVLAQQPQAQAHTFVRKSELGRRYRMPTASTSVPRRVLSLRIWASGESFFAAFGFDKFGSMMRPLRLSYIV